MRPAEILAELHRRGVEVVAAGDRIRYRPAAKVPPELLEEIRAHGSELLAALDPAKHEDPAEPEVVVVKVLAAGDSGVMVLERRPVAADGAVSWERVCQVGETVELAGGQTQDPFIAAAWVELIGGVERAHLFRQEWGLAGVRVQT